MGTVTIPKVKYEELKRKADAFEFISRAIEQEFFAPPPTRNVRQVIGEFKKVGRYNKDFLKSLRRGLERSGYFRK